MKTRLALFAAAALVLVGLAPAPASADEGDVTWTVRTESNSFGATRSSFSYAVNPGAQTKDGLVVANRGKTGLKLGVYAADGFTTDTGTLDLQGAGAKGKGIGAWVHAARKNITVAAGKTVTVPFTVEIPSNATPGDYVGGIITSLTQADDSAQVNVDRRLGIKIKLRVGGDLTPALKIENTHISYDGTANPFGKGTATIDYTIHNVGNAVETAQQGVQITGPFGLFKAETTKIADPPELLPGESWKVSVPVEGVTAAILLDATVTLVPQLTDASGSTSSLDKVTATAHGWAWPWTLLALVVALIALIVAAVVLTRRNRSRRKAREDARVRDAVADALRDKATAAG
ncbi:WxL protein peptidoglycan domain-containing protein [Paractinoplanes atraurantiacus]|uniref:WxL Interacting Protein peptidoglycan binding domain-containing protein n=1 Tax=Paractinoplanes atraurantiacus TaxID=1036182 RepID=A0A285K1N8_9ACTN|nr:DUF916 domain-containing protein [Actinoplanes atraurantiacus]SNY65426.1 protein of unknown function [Actinoplanes atraurantiacus]